MTVAVRVAVRPREIRRVGDGDPARRGRGDRGDGGRRDDGRCLRAAAAAGTGGRGVFFRLLRGIVEERHLLLLAADDGVVAEVLLDDLAKVLPVEVVDVEVAADVVDDR